MNNIKNIAYNFLIKYRINSLNFNFDLLEEIALSNNWELCSYTINKDLILSLNLEKNMELDAFSFISKNKTLIFYNDNLQYNDILFNVLHEFGHIFLEHTNQNGILGYSNITQKLIQQENEANTFACEVLAPSCILKQLDINSIDDILKFCNLPIKHSIYHINNITNFSNIDDISERLIKIFNEYIKKNTYNKEETKIKHKKQFPLLLSFSLTTIIVIIIILFLTVNKNHSSDNTNKNNSFINQFEETSINNDETFYVTKTGSKYHLKNCRYVKDKNNLMQLNINDDNFKNYEPCSVCIK